jgi:ABC-type transport system involved in cytochrome c biogenesis ATPase subunit
MRKLSRWYNVDVQYVGQPTQEDFVGTISQKEELSEILRMLELTGALHFKVDSLSSQGKERRIIVMP